ncbi:unnamed protein product [Ilex paraguariensis]|uniref:Pre-mRNA-processing factor 39 n=1 Tax=Ilex paraguariensis TaxID=185542 RepID=A0ABC8SYB9_9AQUA
MGDSEAMIAQASVVMDYTPAGYSSTDYGGISTTAVPDGGASTVGSDGDLAASAAPNSTATATADLVTMDAADAGAYVSDVGDGNECHIDPNSSEHDAPTMTTYDANENLMGIANASVDSSQCTAYYSSVNGNNVNEAKNIVSAGINENAINSNSVHGSASMYQLVEGAALSAEEERLWSIVRINSLDFNAWTALIEETERTAEDNISKIRKVYDAFLAEFPLCYGYWKKYADYEAHLGSIENVVEVYERAIQGVTYSVDMWLHYCIFSISTYQDPDTIRRALVIFIAFQPDFSMCATAISQMDGIKAFWGCTSEKQFY